MTNDECRFRSLIVYMKNAAKTSLQNRHVVADFIWNGFFKSHQPTIGYTDLSTDSLKNV